MKYLLPILCLFVFSCDDDDNPMASLSCDDVVCTSSSSCVISSCVEGSCIESNVANGAVCDDGDACTYNDVCNEGSCASGSYLNCDDGNMCTDDSCDVVEGCFNNSNTYACDDGDACTSGDACNGGSCAGVSIPNCP